MEVYNVLFNPYSGGGKGEEFARKLDNVMKSVKLIYHSMPKIKDFKKFFKDNAGHFIICGGDGTLNYFFNKIKDIKHKRKIYYYSTGTGNDFYNDIGNNQTIPFEITNYVSTLPRAIINGEEHVFINDCGIGLDGYCCKEAQRQRRHGKKKISYALIALKGILFGIKRSNLKIKVDGKNYFYKNAWMAVTMNGRYFGGGMKIAPNQDRANKDNKLTLIVVDNASRLYCLLRFKSIFSGNHIKCKKVHSFVGKHFEVSYEMPCSIEIDGEPILNVKKYEIKSR